jgi:uncharacterized protein YdeI (YjbR/CyaY-like superfamily)
MIFSSRLRFAPLEQYSCMEITKVVYFTSRQKWREWLQGHYKTEPEVWLQFYKKETGKPRISYNDAVEEALCFGWIDSIVKSYDKESFVQRFSPRRPKTPYSQTNKERLKLLVAEKKVVPEVAASLHAVAAESFVIAKDIVQAIKKNKEAWRYFQSFSDSYKRIRIGFIEGARQRPEEFQKRLKYFIEMTAQGKQFGFGGVEKYF